MRWLIHGGISEAEWSAGLPAVALFLSESKLTKIKLLKVNLNLTTCLQIDLNTIRT